MRLIIKIKISADFRTTHICNMRQLFYALMSILTDIGRISMDWDQRSPGLLDGEGWALTPDFI